MWSLGSTRWYNPSAMPITRPQALALLQDAARRQLQEAGPTAGEPESFTAAQLDAAVEKYVGLMQKHADAFHSSGVKYKVGFDKGPKYIPPLERTPVRRQGRPRVHRPPDRVPAQGRRLEEACEGPARRRLLRRPLEARSDSGYPLRVSRPRRSLAPSAAACIC